jgi:pycsar effector protein
MTNPALSTPDTQTAPLCAAVPAAALLPTAITDVQAQMGRVDTKASMLLAGSLTALSVGIALLAKADLDPVTTAGAVLILALIGSAVALLLTAVRPALRGNHGFVRWASAPTPGHLTADLTRIGRHHTAHQTQQLHGLARSVDRKYRLVRHAVDLLRIALIVAALTAALALI